MDTLWIVGLLLFTAILVVMINYSIARKTKPLWQVLAASIDGRANSGGVRGLHAGRAVQARTSIGQTYGQVNVQTLYTYELKMAAGVPGQGYSWSVTADDGRGQRIQSQNASVRDGQMGANILAVLDPWLARDPTPTAGIAYKADTGMLSYKHTTSQSAYGTDLKETMGGAVKMYSIPTPEQFAAQLELLSALAAINDQFDSPGGTSSAPA